MIDREREYQLKTTDGGIKQTSPYAGLTRSLHILMQIDSHFPVDTDTVTVGTIIQMSTTRRPQNEQENKAALLKLDSLLQESAVRQYLH